VEWRKPFSPGLRTLDHSPTQTAPIYRGATLRGTGAGKAALADAQPVPSFLLRSFLARQRGSRLAPSPIFEFRLPYRVKKRRKWFLAVCESLDVASQGPTREKALDNLRDAIRGFLADCFDRGTLDEVLQQAGFVSAQKPAETFRYSRGAHWLTVPIALLAREQQPTRASVQA
jgi:predicted RNase H-like HicB family nuclease